MDRLSWVAMIADMQAGEGGEAVKTVDIIDASGYSRSLVQLRLRELITAKILIRPKKGRYMLNGDNQFLRKIGLSVLLPLDVYEFRSRFYKQ